MTMLTNLDPQVISTGAKVLLHFLWEGMLIWVLAASLLRLARHQSANFRYGISISSLWLLVFCPAITWMVLGEISQKPTKLATQPVVEMSSLDGISEPNPLQPLHADHESFVPMSTELDDKMEFVDLSSLTSLEDLDPIDDVQLAPEQQPHSQFADAIMIFWFVGVAFFTVRLCISYLCGLQLTFGKSLPPRPIAERISLIASKMNWRGDPRVYLHSNLSEAIVVGYLKPIVLLPVSWTTTLSIDAVEAVIIHELTHIRRFDLWVILLQRLVETVLFFHPAVWWISQRLSHERELCCDADALRSMSSPVTYATGLRQVAELLLAQNQSQPRGVLSSWLPLSPTFGGQKMELLQRVKCVLETSPTTGTFIPRRRFSHIGTVIAIPVLLSMLLVSIVAATTNEPQQQTKSETDQEERKPEPWKVKSESEATPATESNNPLAGMTFFETTDGVAFEEDARFDRGDALDKPEKWLKFAKAVDSSGKLLRLDELRVAVEREGGMIRPVIPVRAEMFREPSPNPQATPAKKRVKLIVDELSVQIHFGDNPYNGEAPTDQSVPVISPEVVGLINELDFPCRLFLTNDSVDDRTLKSLAENDSIISMLIKSKRVTDEGLTAVSKMEKLTHLEWYSGCTKAGLETIAKKSNLKAIGIDASQLTTDDLKSIRKLDQLTSLWIVRGRHLTADVMETITSLKKLREMTLQFVPLETDDLRKLSELPELESLTLNRGPEEAQRLGNDELKALLNLPNLKGISLWHVDTSKSMLDEIRTGKIGNAADQPLKSVGIRFHDCRVEFDEKKTEQHDLVTLSSKIRGEDFPSPEKVEFEPMLTLEYEELSPRIRKQYQDAERRAWNFSWTVLNSDRLKSIQEREKRDSERRKTSSFELPFPFKLEADEQRISLENVRDGSFGNLLARNGTLVADDLTIEFDELTFQASPPAIQIRNGVVTILREKRRVEVEADRIELQEFEGSIPGTIEASKNVKMSDQQLKQNDRDKQEWTQVFSTSGNQLRWNLKTDSVQNMAMSSATQPAANSEITLVSVTQQADLDDEQTNQNNEAKKLSAAEVGRRLSTVVKVDAAKSTLGEVVESIAQQGDFQIVFDQSALEKRGINKNAEVSLIISGVQAWSALKLVLEKYDLWAVVKDGMVHAVGLAEYAEELRRELQVDRFREEVIHQQLQVKVTPSFENQTFHRVVEGIFPAKATVLYDEVSLNDLNLSSDSKVSFVTDTVSSKQALEQFLTPLNLGFIVEDGFLKITTRAKVRRSLTQRVGWYETLKRDPLQRALHQRLTYHKINQPLAEFLQFIAKKYGINIVLDEFGLKEEGLTAQTPVTIDCDEIPLGRALELMLKPLGLAYSIDDEVLKVTSQHRKDLVNVQVYELGDLVDDADKPQELLKTFINLIESTVSPGSWSQVGGEGMITPHNQTLSIVVRQSNLVHQEIEELLKQLRRLKEGYLPPLQVTNPSQKREDFTITMALRQRGSIDVMGLPLRDAVSIISSMAGVPIFIDQQGLQEEGHKDASMPVTLKASNVRFDSMLRHLTEQLGIGYYVEDVVVISSRLRSKGPMTVVIYEIDAETLGDQTLGDFGDELQRMIDPDNWSVIGGEGSLTIHESTNSLVIRQSREVHKQIKDYLAALYERSRDER